MKNHPVIILAAVVVMASATTIRGQKPAPKAPAASASAAGSVRAHADIKGEGITGTADFVESQQGNGKIVNVTVTGTAALACPRRSAACRSSRSPPT